MLNSVPDSYIEKSIKFDNKYHNIIDFEMEIPFIKSNNNNLIITISKILYKKYFSLKNFKNTLYFKYGFNDIIIYGINNYISQKADNTIKLNFQNFKYEINLNEK